MALHYLDLFVRSFIVCLCSLPSTPTGPGLVQWSNTEGEDRNRAMKRSLTLIWDNRKLSVMKEFINIHCLKNYAPTLLVCWKE